MRKLIIPDRFDYEHEPANSETLKCDQHFPLSQWQRISNELFYNGHSDPLDLIGTLGSSDPMLPHSYAVDYLDRNCAADEVHEVGPGNFNFARTFVDTIRGKLSDSFQYHCYDPYSASFEYHKNSLRPYEHLIQYHQASIEELSNLTLNQTEVHTVLVEVIDDAMTEHCAINEGQEYVLTVSPVIESDKTMESKSFLYRYFVQQGDFRQARLFMRGDESIQDRFSAREIMSMLNAIDLDGLRKVSPSFLALLQYNTGAVPISVDQILQRHFPKRSAEFGEYIHAVQEHFRQQLRNAPEGNSVSIPIAGIQLLWDMSKKRRPYVDIFDYGYDAEGIASGQSGPLSYKTYQGQVTAPVNFEILRFAAQELGFSVILEKNRDYITNHTGQETVLLQYLLRNMSKTTSLTRDQLKQLMYGWLQDSVLGFSIDKRPSEVGNMVDVRVSKADAERFWHQSQEHGVVTGELNLDEGSFHLSAFK